MWFLVFMAIAIAAGSSSEPKKSEPPTPIPPPSPPPPPRAEPTVIEEELPVNVKEQFRQMSEWTQRLFDAKRRALWEAGYIGSAGHPTEEGMTALHLLLWEQNEEALVEKAKERIRSRGTDEKA